MLLNRRAECRELDRLVSEVVAGNSRALVLTGDAGIGKSALLDYACEQAARAAIVQTAGVEAEKELAYAALHQLCAPMLDSLQHVPQPQADALRTAFGLAAGNPPDRVMVALAVLSLLSEVARDRPLLCVVDDVQWIDRASAQVMGFAARRLGNEAVAMIFAVRESGQEPGLPELAGLPTVRVEGLPTEEARSLLTMAHGGPLDRRILDRIVAESHGNPLALQELPKGFTPAELAGGFGLLNAEPLPRRIEESFRRQIAGFSSRTRQVVLVAAAEPVGDPAVLWRAVEQLDVTVDPHAISRELAGLVDLGAQVRFRHPLLRSAVYRSASPPERRRAHSALAEVVDAAKDPSASRGTERRPLWNPMRTSLQSWSAAPYVPRAAVALQRQRPCSNVHRS